MKLRQLLELNDEIACFIGFWLNLTVILFVIRWSKENMKQYNAILLQSSIIDLLLIVTTITIRPMVIITKGTEYITSNGWFHKSSQLVECLAIIIWEISALFSIAAIPVAYVFRYRVLCHKQNITLYFYIFSIGIAFLSALTFGICAFCVYYIIGGNFAHEAEHSLSDNFKDESGKVGAAGTLLGRSLGIYAIAGVAGLIIIISYAICIYCNIKVIKYLKDNSIHICNGVQALQKELTITLTAQALAPFLLVILPLKFQIICIYFPQLDMDIQSVYSTMVLSWIPTGNALSVLLFVKAFRMRILKFFKCGKKGTLPVTLIGHGIHISKVGITDTKISNMLNEYRLH